MKVLNKTEVKFNRTKWIRKKKDGNRNKIDKTVHEKHSKEFYYISFLNKRNERARKKKKSVGATNGT